MRMDEEWDCITPILPICSAIPLFMLSLFTRTAHYYSWTVDGCTFYLSLQNWSVEATGPANVGQVSIYDSRVVRICAEMDTLKSLFLKCL